MIFLLVLYLAIICYIDVKTKTIGDGFTLLGILVALNQQLFYGDIEASVLGITAGVGIVWIMNIARLKNLGGGDAKLVAMIGAFTDWKVAVSTALVAAIIFLPFSYGPRAKRVAYAPYITVAFILVILWIGKSFLKI